MRWPDFLYGSVGAFMLTCIIVLTHSYDASPCTNETHIFPYTFVDNSDEPSIMTPGEAETLCAG